MKTTRIFLLILLWTTPFSLIAQSAFLLDNLKVDHQENPLGIETDSPVFSWQMQVPGQERGVFQKAYRIQVTDSRGTLVWDSQQVSSDRSIGIRYQGEKLRPITAYKWSLTVWNQSDQVQTETGKFETGWMDSPTAWQNAVWIGGGSEDMVLYAHALAVLKAGVSIQLDRQSRSTQAAFLLGGNDVRLMNKNLNILQMESGRNASYVGFELDISQVDGTEEGLAQVHAYRVGYQADDRESTPFHSMPIPLRLIHEGNKYDPHHIYLECNLGIFQVYINGTENEYKISPNDPSKPSYVAQGLNLNPMGEGGNYINFPLLADIGFKTASGQQATFSELTISNYRSPGNVLFSETGSAHSIFDKLPNIQATAGRYRVGSDNQAVLALVNPSRSAPPMLRTAFRTQAKKIKKARIYATARGIYEMHLNGKRVGQDYFNPGLTQYNKNHQYQIYDVTDALESNAANAWGAWLSEGWWSGHITFSGGNWNFFGDRQSFLGTLLIEYEDGTLQEINTQPQTWKLYTDGPILNGSFFQGEVYDANKESVLTGWSLAQFDDSNWKSAQVVPLEGTTYTGPMTNGILDYKQVTLSAQNDPSPTIIRQLKAVSMEEVRPGVFVYDMGQNMVGVPKIALPHGHQGDIIDTQASYAIALYLGVIDEGLQEKALANLIATLARENTDDSGVLRPAYSLMTGFIATAAINEALSRYGDPVHAYRLLQQTSYPSWLYSVKNGATTIWERLNSYTLEDGFGGNNSMNSFNHYSFGAVGAWMYNYSLGIQRHPEIPGFKKFRLQPQPDPDGKMSWAKGHYDSMYGRIHSEWKRGEDGWEYKATVPPNTSAVLVLPVKDLERITEGGTTLTEVPGIALMPKENGNIRMELSSGSYSFTIK